jgi:hypothetical protein
MMNIKIGEKIPHLGIKIALPVLQLVETESRLRQSTSAG